MDNDFDIKTKVLSQVTLAELEKARQRMEDQVSDWITQRYPNIRLDVLDRNLSVILELKKYDDACKMCVGAVMCPGEGSFMNGRLMPDGVINFWMQPCPKGMKLPKRQEGETAAQYAEKTWARRE